jgi:hypothetical protein
MLIAPKPVPHTPSPSESRTNFTLGTASLVVGEEGGLHGLKGYEALPDWVVAGKEPHPLLREGESKAEYESSRVVPASERLDSAFKEVRAGSPSTTNGFGASDGKGKTLDDWLAEDEKDAAIESSEEESGEEEESEEESSEETSEAEDEDESDDDEEHDRLVK